LRPSGIAGVVLELAPLRWIGRLSYSLYLTNNAFLPFQSIGIPISLGALQRAPVNVGAVVVSAAALYFCIERPMIRLGHRLGRPSSAIPLDGSQPSDSSQMSKEAAAA